jgi:hypothetical protein
VTDRCDLTLHTSEGDHPCAKPPPHRIHGRDCDLGLRWIRNPDGSTDLTGHLHRVSANMRVSHE